MANYYSVNLDKTGSVFTITSIFRAPTTLASGGTEVVAIRANPNDTSTFSNADFNKVMAGVLDIIGNDRSVQNA
jgi:hypothetical protein